MLTFPAHRLALHWHLLPSTFILIHSYTFLLQLLKQHLSCLYQLLFQFLIYSSDTPASDMCLHCLQVWPRERWCPLFSVATGCPNLTSVPLSCMRLWCPAGKASPKTDPPLTTYRASWMTSTPQQRDSTNISHSSACLGLYPIKTFKSHKVYHHCSGSVFSFFAQVFLLYILHMLMYTEFVLFHYDQILNMGLSHLVPDFESFYMSVYSEQFEIIMDFFSPEWVRATFKRKLIFGHSHLHSISSFLKFFVAQGLFIH